MLGFSALFSARRSNEHEQIKQLVGATPRTIPRWCRRRRKRGNSLRAIAADLADRGYVNANGKSFQLLRSALCWRGKTSQADRTVARPVRERNPRSRSDVGSIGQSPAGRPCWSISPNVIFTCRSTLHAGSPTINPLFTVSC